MPRNPKRAGRPHRADRIGQHPRREGRADRPGHHLQAGVLPTTSTTARAASANAEGRRQPRRRPRHGLEGRRRPRRRAALAHRPSSGPPREQLVAGYLDYITNVQKLALRTQDRYRAALDRFLDFCKAADLVADRRFRRSDGRRLRASGSGARPGPATARREGKRDVYKTGGIKFILSTCRTAFNWAGRRRMLPALRGEPVHAAFPSTSYATATSEDEGQRVFTPAQERAFFVGLLRVATGHLPDARHVRPAGRRVDPSADRGRRPRRPARSRSARSRSCSGA